MSLMDPLADALTNIRNNELQVNDSCVISPASKLTLVLFLLLPN